MEMDEEKSKRLDADFELVTEKIKEISSSMSDASHWHNGALEAVAGQIAEEMLAGLTAAIEAGNSPSNAVRNMSYNFTQMFFFAGYEIAQSGHELDHCNCKEVLLEEGGFIEVVQKMIKEQGGSVQTFDTDDLPGNYL
jgi:hypothetical protein